MDNVFLQNPHLRLENNNATPSCFAHSRIRVGVVIGVKIGEFFAKAGKNILNILAKANYEDCINQSNAFLLPN